MNEKVKIISDGIHAEVWIDGVKCAGVSRVEFAHIIPTECSTLKLDYIVPAIKSISMPLPKFAEGGILFKPNGIFIERENVDECVVPLNEYEQMSKDSEKLMEALRKADWKLPITVTLGKLSRSEDGR